MQSDDLVGLLVFLAIVVITSIIRALKEMKKKEPEQSPEIPKPTAERRFKEPEKQPPKRKLIIRKEEEPTFSPPPPPPVFTPPTKTLESREDLFEESEEEKEIPIASPQKSYAEPYREPHREKPIIISEKKPHKDVIETKPKPPKTKEESYSTLKTPQITFTAPMKRITPTQQTSSRLSLQGNIEGIPKLHWALIMQEILSPPKALRND